MLRDLECQPESLCCGEAGMVMRSFLYMYDNEARKSGTQSTMTIRFPNASRFYDRTRDAVHFWGYDQSMETSFFITAAAFSNSPQNTASRGGAAGAFDSNRARIFEVATRIYGHGSLGISDDLTPADF